MVHFRPLLDLVTFAASTPATFDQTERISILSLIEYVASEQQASPALVRDMVEARFGVHDIASIPHQSFGDVVCFLVDLRVKASCH